MSAVVNVDVAIEPSQVRDPRELREPGLALGRDPVRTPMPWDDSANAGFTKGTPWLPLHDDWPTQRLAHGGRPPIDPDLGARGLRRHTRGHERLSQDL